MHARRALLPIILVAGFLAVHGDSRSPTLRVEVATPHVAAIATIAPRTIEDLKHQLSLVMVDENITGLAIALVNREGSIWTGGLGIRDRETGAWVDRDTAFRVGSLSKTIIALGVMRLVDQGKLEIDRPLREILPDVALDNPWEATAPVTLAHCLEHTAGLDDVRFNEIFTTDERLSVRDTLALNPRSRIVRWRPGTRHAYSNVGYTLAGRAIEVATGEPFDDYIKREILAPLGITDADFLRTPTLAGRLATGYQDGNATPFHAFAHRPSGGLLASAADLAKLVHFSLERGEGYPSIVSAASLARIERSGTLPYGPLGFEYGFANYGDVSHPVKGRGHDGGMPGFHATFRYLPDLGVGYAFLLNSNYTYRGYARIRALLFGYLAQGRTFPPPPDPVAHDAVPGARYFELAAPRNALFAFIDRAVDGWHVSRDADRVGLGHLRGATFELVPTSDGAYRFVDEYGSSIRFTTVDGTPAMVWGNSYAEAASGWFAELRFRLLDFAILLLRFAPLWSAGILAASALRRRRIVPLSLVVWPALAGLSCAAVPLLLFRAFEDGVIGDVHPRTVALCALTIVFAIASTATLYSAIRWAMRPDRPSWFIRIIPTICGVAFFGLTLWFAANHIIGLRTWAW